MLCILSHIDNIIGQWHILVTIIKIYNERLLMFVFFIFILFVILHTLYL